MFDKFRTAQWGPFTGLALILLMALMIGVIGVIVFVEGGQRRIPVQYAKRVMGRRMMGGQMTYLPLRVNSGGVIPPIFASSLLTFPGTINLFLGRKFTGLRLAGHEPRLGRALVHSGLHHADYRVRVFLCGDRLQSDRAGRQHAQVRRIHSRAFGRAAIPPSTSTACLRRLTFVGGVYLAAVCLLPEWLMAGIHLQHLPLVGGNWFDNHMWRFVLEGLKVNFYFGGTSLLIVVGVAMDTVQQIEAQLVMRNYEGFVKKGKLRGRRYG